MCYWIPGPQTCRFLSINFKILADMFFSWLFCAGGPRDVESGHNLYDPKSGTKLHGSKFDITYGSGFASGDIYADRVTLGGITTTQVLGCATSVDENDLGDYQMDGILGLGFNSGSSKVYNGYPQPTSAIKNPMNSSKPPMVLPVPQRYCLSS
jgi:hypothetical protein